MIGEPKVFGRVFLTAADIPDDEDLVFVSRAAKQANRPPKTG